MCFALHVPNKTTGEGELVRKFDSHAHATAYLVMEFDPWETPTYAIVDERTPILLDDDDILDDPDLNDSW